MKIDRNLIIPGKLSYVRGKKPDVECILCAIRDRDSRVKNLEVYRSDLMIVSLNLFPYNPGHMMIFPLRHVTDIRQLEEQETADLHRLQRVSMDVLDQSYQPCGYNIGFNIGRGGGASIEHLHCHVVPRYPHEIGLVEMLSQGTRVHVEDPSEVMEKLGRAFAEYDAGA